MSALYEQEHLQALNLHSDAMSRRRLAAERAIEIDPSLQQGWRCLGMSSFFDRDLAGLRIAAERVQQLNPLNTSTVAYMGLHLANAGDWERGIPMVRRCMALNPQHPRWCHLPISFDRYHRGEFEDALTQAKLANLPHLAMVPLMMAAAAGQLGRTMDARAAFDSLRKNHPACLDARTARDRWASLVWDLELVESFVEGFEKAQALVAAEPQTPSGPTPRSSPVKSPTSGRNASIAVLPFSDMSAAKDQDWFCDGIAEEILNALAGLKGLSVAARASAFSFRGKGDDLKAIGDKLNVTTVLDGSVRRAGDQLRITVRLCDVANGYQLWSERYDRSVNDILPERYRLLRESPLVQDGRGDTDDVVVQGVELDRAAHRRNRLLLSTRPHRGPAQPCPGEAARRIEGDAFLEGADRGLQIPVEEQLHETERAVCIRQLIVQHAMAGDTDAARKGLAELESRSATEYVPHLFQAVVQAALGELDRAFELLNESAKSRNAWLSSPRLPLFDGFRKDPRFVEHLRRIGHADAPVEA